MVYIIRNKTRRIRTFFKDLITRIIKDDFMGMAAEMAYIFILAFFPFMIFLVSLFGIFGSEDQIYRVIDFLNEVSPLQAMGTVERTLMNVMYSSSKELVTIGFITTLFLASNAAVVSIKGMNKAYHRKETRNFWHIRLLSVFIVLLNGIVLFFGTNMIVFGRVIIDFFNQFIDISSAFESTILFIRWPIAFLGLFIMAFVNYYFMPNIKKLGFRKKIAYTVPGALFFCVFWLLASWVFGLYVDNFGSYDKVYGTLGAFAVLLLWLYYTSLIILIGGEINFQVYKKFLNHY